MSKTKQNYPSVHTWSYITIEEFPKNSSCRQVPANLSKIEEFPTNSSCRQVPANLSKIEEFPKNSSCRQVLTNLSKIEEFRRILLIFESHFARFSEIEGYCMLNMECGGCYSRYSYELKPDGSLKRVKNKEYDPSKKPDPYPEGCPRSVRSTCIGCTHFAWCDPGDDEKRDPVQVHAGAGKISRKNFMTSAETVHRMIDDLPPDLRNKAIHYIEELAKRKKKPLKKKFRLTWAGGLSHLKKAQHLLSSSMRHSSGGNPALASGLTDNLITYPE